MDHRKSTFISHAGRGTLCTLSLAELRQGESGLRLKQLADDLQAPEVLHDHQSIRVSLGPNHLP